MPVDGDTVTINAAVDVEFNVDQSGFANGLSTQTINGTLHVSNTAGAYYWKCNGGVTWGAAAAYRANNGTPGQPLPANVTFEQHFNANFSNVFNATTTLDINCQNSPTHKLCKLSSGASLGDTVLNVDTDLTGGGDSAYWIANAWGNPTLINIDNIAQGAQSEQRTLTVVSATQITISVGLTAAKLAGSYIFIISRNVKITATGTGAGTLVSAAQNFSISAEFRAAAIAFSSCIAGVVGGTISVVGTGFITCQGCVLNGVLSQATNAVNSGTAFQLASGAYISGATGSGMTTHISGLVAGIITGCLNGVNTPNEITVTGSILNCNTGASSGSGLLLRSATLSNNNFDVSQAGMLQAFNTLFGSATEFRLYNNSARQLWDYAESMDHDQVAYAYRAWTTGGITSTVASPVYDNRARSYNAVCESASLYAFWQRTVYVPAYGSINVAVAVQKDASMAYLPNVQIFPASAEPLISGSASLTLTMTNSTNTWEVLEGSVTNATDAGVYYVVRMLAKNATGNVYWSPVIRVSSFWAAPGLDGGLS